MFDFEKPDSWTAVFDPGSWVDPPGPSSVEDSPEPASMMMALMGFLVMAWKSIPTESPNTIPPRAMPPSGIVKSLR